MTKAEMILKIVLVPSAPPDMFVESYFKLFQERDIAEFQKILDMKGLKKAESTNLLELFRKKFLTVDHSVDNFASADGDEQLNSALDSSRIKRLEKMIKKRL